MHETGCLSISQQFGEFYGIFLEGCVEHSAQQKSFYTNPEVFIKNSSSTLTGTHALKYTKHHTFQIFLIETKLETTPMRTNMNKIIRKVLYDGAFVHIQLIQSCNL